jgi:hypothetical protein
MPTALTPWFKCDGASASADERGFNLTLPGFLVPLRRYCEVLVQAGPLPETVLVRVDHLHAFDVPKPGFNAWQSAYIRDCDGLKSGSGSGGLPGTSPNCATRSGCTAPDPCWSA